MPDSNERMMLAAIAAKAMKIEEIFMLRSLFTRDANLPSNEEISLKSEFGFVTDHVYDSESSQLAANVTLHARGFFDEDGDEKQLFRVEASYLVRYSQHKEDVIPAECLEAFASLNGVYNTWPYWREYVQSVTCRLGIPPLTLPLLTGAAIQAVLDKNDPIDDHDDHPVKALASSEQE